VVSCGGTSVIDISAELTEREKISAIAHQLGHIALGHMRRKPIRFLRAMDELPARNSNDTEEEMEACAWAAHLLVQRELYEAKLDQAQLAHEGDPGQAAKCAIAMTADALNITPLTVSCRLEHEDANFPVPPLEWLQGQC
jgi:Zn-dependent peptidase ImmA (M78 family)